MTEIPDTYLTGFYVSDMLDMLCEAADQSGEYDDARVDGYELHLDLPDAGKHVVIDAGVLRRVYSAVMDDIAKDVHRLFAEGEIYFPLVHFLAKSDLDEFETEDTVEALLNLCVEHAMEG